MQDQDKNSLIQIWDELFDSYEGLGFCLSEHGDSLSQWRGYAQNAEGFCIGFSQEGLRWQRANLLGHNDRKKRSYDLIQVNYDIDRQREELKPAYQKIKERIDAGAFKKLPRYPHMSPEEETMDLGVNELEIEIMVQIGDMLPKFFQQKNPAFKEEKEWRAVAGFGKPVDRDNIEFRSVGNRIVPYRSFNFDPEIIAEVILGPTNQTPIDIVEIILEKFGYFGWAAEGLNVKKSEASYR